MDVLETLWCHGGFHLKIPIDDLPSTDYRLLLGCFLHVASLLLLLLPVGPSATAIPFRSFGAAMIVASLGLLVLSGPCPSSTWKIHKLGVMSEHDVKRILR